MGELPIIFSAPMVRALIQGRKTQTRRLIKQWRYGAPRLQYMPGDRLYVREAWTARMTHGWTIADARSRMFQEEILYRADGHESDDGWWPSIHMPREFSRLTLTVTEVRVQRLQDISEEDALAEGCPAQTDDELAGYEARGWFRDLWNSLHGPGAWDANPWVVVLTFTVQHGNIDRLEGRHG